MFHAIGNNLGVSDSFRFNGEAPAIQLLSFETEEANEETRLALFLEPGEQVYRIAFACCKTAFMIENARCQLAATRVDQRRFGVTQCSTTLKQRPRRRLRSHL